ncbi:hypothetical protein CN676_10400 [Bacillus wiedmannii]|uniref:hypothetical protein n=1 Tax=Bacillus wiedmannii TaxID=1890302 RepID=UPI000BF164A9|nr:hypothetical protein [Bacillus wiedmannii]PEJ53030.1 hypothetical protein CN676_10400 [Bacillus wiedmannii]PGE57129.1 hypothetical protein COM65_24885 [Bacillus wiedmannii]
MSLKTLLTDIEIIENEIKNELEKSNVQTTLSLNTYNKMLEKIESIKDNSTLDFSLVFIGEKGIGKTTSICRILNLVHKVSKRRKNKSIKVIEEILQTGSGATTICDIEITPSQTGKTFITIEAVSEQDLLDYLRSFAEYIFAKAHKKTNEIFREAEEGIPLPPEIERACRNMTNLKETKEFENRIDHGIELASRFASDELGLFIDAVISCANFEKRSQEVFQVDYNLSMEDELLWIKNIFKNLNLGKIDTAPLPKVIKIHLSKEIFNFDDLPFINKIVDTRGLDSLANSDRKDLYKIFREEPNNIIILIDKFAAPSLSLIDLLNTYAYDENLSLIDRMIFLVNFRNNEPNLVVGVDGTVEEENEGIEIRKKQILRKFIENRIPFNENNIIFYNPLRFLDSEKRLEVTMDDLDEYGDKEEVLRYKNETIQYERQGVLKQVNDTVLNIVEKYDQEINEIRINLEKIKYSHENDQYAKNQIIKVIKDVEGYYQDNIKAKEDVLKIYNNYFMGKYPSTIRAINTRHGIYDHHDIYQEGAIRIEDLVKYQLKDIKDNVLLKLEGIKSFVNISSGQEVAIKMLMEDIGELYEERVNRINRTVYHTFEKNVFSFEKYEQFWRKTNYRWGQGNGYRLDIIEYYQDQIKESQFLEAIDSFLVNSVNSFVEDLVSIMEEIS